MSLHHSSRWAFTLVELLVSMVVLVLVVVTVVGLTNAVSGTTTASRRRLDVDNEARRVLDRIGSDFARMLKRADADSLFVATNGNGGQGANDKFFVYSESPAYFDTLSPTSPPPNDPRGTAGLIGYRVNNVAASANRWQLERLGKGLTWDGAASSSAPGGVVFLTYPAASPSPAPTPTPYPASTLAVNWKTTVGNPPAYDDGADMDYQVLSPSVFRLEYCFVLKSGGATNTFTRTHDQTQGFKDVAGVVVAIALLDPQARALVSGGAAGSTPDLSNLVAALPDPDFTTAPGTLMAEIWNGKIRAGTFATSAGVSTGVAANVRIYQRYFPLNTPN